MNCYTFVRVSLIFFYFCKWITSEYQPNTVRYLVSHDLQSTNQRQDPISVSQEVLSLTPLYNTVNSIQQSCQIIFSELTISSQNIWYNIHHSYFIILWQYYLMLDSFFWLIIATLCIIRLEEGWREQHIIIAELSQYLTLSSPLNIILTIHHSLENTKYRIKQFLKNKNSSHASKSIS